jgi:hypothetical protein
MTITIARGLLLISYLSILFVPLTVPSCQSRCGLCTPVFADGKVHATLEDVLAEKESSYRHAWER